MKLAKVCILGEVSVGKTSLIRRFVDRSFSDAYLSTVGVKISRKLLRIPAPESGREDDLQLVLWDLEGGHTWLDISSTYLKGARGAVIVGDLTRPSTVEEIRGHVGRFRRINPTGRIVVALNKMDLQGDAQNDAMIDISGDNTGVLATHHTSAKSGEGVDELFIQLGSHLLRDMGNGSHD